MSPLLEYILSARGPRRDAVSRCSAALEIGTKAARMRKIKRPQWSRGYGNIKG